LKQENEGDGASPKKKFTKEALSPEKTVSPSKKKELVTTAEKQKGAKEGAGDLI